MKKETIWVIYVILMIVSLFCIDKFYGNDLDSDLESMAEVVWAISSEESSETYDYEVVEIA